MAQAVTHAGGGGGRGVSRGARLSFKGKLYNKGVTADRLLRDLKQIQKELAQMEQDAVDLDALKDMCKQLTQPTLMLHKDKGVKVAVACCLADMLRLFAPDAPFTAHELRDIFQFFIHLLTQSAKTGAGLACPQGPYYADYFYLVESLSTVKSICLVCELGGAEEMMYDLFKGFMELVSPNMSKNVEICMADVLAQLIDEAQQLPDAVLEVLLANFSPKAVKANPAAHQLTIEVCKATENRIQKDVAKYFRDAISTAFEEENHDERDKELASAHAIIMQINCSVPGLLLTVIPLLEEDLTRDDVALRLLSVRTLGQMFGERPSKTSGAGEGQTARMYPSAWKSWMGRAADKSPLVRAKWVECLRNILTYHSTLLVDVGPALEAKTEDADEKVRVAVARLIDSLDYETALHGVPKSVLLLLADRCKDKKASVRLEAMTALGRLFNMAYTEIESHEPAATQQFFWIPTKIIHSLKSPDNTPLAVASVLEKYILPYPADPENEAAWTARLLLVLKVGDSFTNKVLFKLSNLFDAKRPTLQEAFIDACEQYNSGIIDANEDEVRSKFRNILKLTARALGEQPGADRIAADLAAFAKLNENRLYRLFKTSMDPKQDLKTLLKCRAEIIKRLSSSSTASVVETMSLFWRSASFPFINRSTVSHLLRGLQQGKARFTASQLKIDSQRVSTVDSSEYETFIINAQLILKQIGSTYPSMFTPHLPELIKCLFASSDNGATAAAEPALRAIASVACAEPRSLTLVREKRVVDRIADFVRKGSALEAKFAAKTLAVMSDSKTRKRAVLPPLSPPSPSSLSSSVGGGTPIKPDSFAARATVDAMLEEIARKLGKASGNRAVAYVHAATQIVKHSPDMFEDKAQAIIKEVLARVRQPWAHAKQENRGEEVDEKDWIEEEEIGPDLQVRLLALDLMTKRAEAYAETEHKETTAKPTLRFISTVLQEGEAGQLGTPVWAKSRQRLRAAICILKLARHTELEKLISTADFSTLAFVVQDECFGVRNGFLQRLATYLSHRKLGVRYYTIPFLVAFDPEEENQELVRYFVHNAILALPKAHRLEKFERTFARFLHLLAHHPDFQRANSEDVLQFSQYIDFYLNALSTPENMSMFYYIAGRLKTIRDSASVGASENLYTLSELAQLAIKRKAAAQAWTLETWPGRMSMPDDIFKPLPSKEVLKEVYERQFLPEEVSAKLNEVIDVLSTKVSAGGSLLADTLACACAQKRIFSLTHAP
ncbi:cohesin-associated protein Pds5 [Tilletiaria anomala UBC 951]|uniref:Cohesin-associated protein Pds5 n=1 Tax=Tilletiaria anomala (strain ATCC 24038 / CBS 436.72 / UBC 951) TaxID=1037660 RepID=A0A066W167_TILAU|nr:cohesin-associated protein Pds5 [Tilletiaria anomala UBC 951]KDN46283.1 cohesin-associated protein Pds5 [Tilletiaria anomala UBC 951]